MEHVKRQLLKDITGDAQTLWLHDTLSPAETAPLLELRSRRRFVQGNFDGGSPRGARSEPCLRELQRLGRSRGGGGTILLAQATANRPRIDLQQLRSPQTVVSRVL